MARELVVSLCQMDIAVGQPATNIEAARAMVSEAARRGSYLVVLPELWTSGYNLPDLAEMAKREQETWVSIVSGWARELGIHLHAGSMAEWDGVRLFNTSRVYAPDGHELASYRKIHRVPMLDEEKYLGAGDRAVLCNELPVRAGLLICYDLRFPELSRVLSLGGAQMLVVPAEWPAARIEHWRTLLQARAIENQCYVLGVNRVGTSNGVAFGGRSAVVAPWGDRVIEAGTEQALLTASIRQALVEDVRRQVPALRDRVPEAYRLDGGNDVSAAGTRNRIR